MAQSADVNSRKSEQERHAPFDITADPDPFYNESSVRELKRRLDDIEAGTARLEEHELIEVDRPCWMQKSKIIFGGMVQGKTECEITPPVGAGRQESSMLSLNKHMEKSVQV